MGNALTLARKREPNSMRRPRGQTGFTADITQLSIDGVE
jgi:hypothetical protein